MRKQLVATVVLAVAMTGAGAHADAFKPSKEDQVKLGQRVAGELKRTEKVLPATDVRVQMLRRVGRRLLSTLPPDTDPWEYSFNVIESKELNAFALPGGPVFFYTGLLDKLTTEDELAGILGHELTHVRKQHWAYGYADSQKRNLGITLLLVFTGANRTTANLAGLANEVIFELPFSRKHEIEADDGGYEMMAKAGYNPAGIADVFKMLGSQSGGKPPEFLSTHPDDKNRVKRLELKVSQDKREFPALKPMDLPKSAPVGDRSGKLG